MAEIYNPWKDPNQPETAGSFLTPTLLNAPAGDSGESSDMGSMESGDGGMSSHMEMMKQALETINQQSMLIQQLTAKLAGGN